MIAPSCLQPRQIWQRFAANLCILSLLWIFALSFYVIASEGGIYGVRAFAYAADKVAKQLLGGSGDWFPREIYMSVTWCVTGFVGTFCLDSKKTWRWLALLWLSYVAYNLLGHWSEGARRADIGTRTTVFVLAIFPMCLALGSFAASKSISLINYLEVKYRNARGQVV